MRVLHLVPVFSAMATVCGPAHGLDAPGGPGGRNTMPGQIIVKLRPVAGKAPHKSAAGNLAKRHGDGAVRPLLAGRVGKGDAQNGFEYVFVFDYPENTELRPLIEALSVDPAVVYAEPNYICRVAAAPDDPYYSTSGTWNQSYADMWGLHKVGLGPIGSDSGWDIETGQSNPVIVAVIDTGLDRNHPDIANQVWSNPGEIPDNGIDDDGNGYIDDVNGWNFAGNSNVLDDGHGHGTHCAGTIAAATNNGIGVAGISWGAKIMAIKGLTDGGYGSVVELANAIIYAADNGARVLSNSWGGIDIYGGTKTLEDACAYAASRGCLIIAAAANNGTDMFPPFPAGYPTVMAVAATGPDDRKAYFSNFGSFVDLAAPGVDILSLRAAGTDMYGDGTRIVGGEYYRANGTSMSCPHVAGAAALVWSANPGFSAEQVQDQLVRTADDVDRLNPDFYANAVGTGRLNVRSALAITPRPLVRFRDVEVVDSDALHPNQATDPGETISLRIFVRNTWLPAAQVQIMITTVDANAAINDGTAVYGAVGSGETRANEHDELLVTISPDCPPNHAIHFAIQIDADGFIWNESFSITVPEPALTVAGRFVLDPLGNQNHALDAGEMVNLLIRLSNAASAGPAKQITASLATSDPHVSLIQPASSYPDIPAGQTRVNTPPFRIALAPTFPQDHVAAIELAVSANGYAVVIPVKLTLAGVTREISLAPPGLLRDPGELNVAVDPQGRIHAGWIQPDGNHRYTAHRIWTHEDWLTGTYISVNYTTPYSMNLAVDSTGRAHITWEESGVVFVFGFPLQIRAAYYRSQENDKWGPLTNVSNTPGTTESVMESLVAIDSSDQAHAVWLYNNYDRGAAVDQRLYHNRQMNGAWQPPAPIFINPTMKVYREMRLKAGPNRRLWLVYAINTPGFAYYRQWDGTAWSAEEWIPTVGQTWGLNAVVDGANRLHIVYRSADDTKQAFYRSLDNGVWSSVHAFPTAPGATALDRVRVRNGPDGTIHLLWTERAGNTADIIRTQRNVSGTWQAAETLVNTGTQVYELDMAVDQAGRRHLFYTRPSLGLFHRIMDAGFLSGWPAFPQGDMDGDWDVDQTDFGLLQACYSGPGVPQSDSSCELADLDSDDDVDAHDFSLFHVCMSGANAPVNPSCAD